MSEDSDAPILGSVDNGSRVQVAFSFGSFRAGLSRPDDSGDGIVAFRANMPPKFDANGTVEGQPVTLLSVKKSITTPGFICVRVRFP